MFKFISKPYFLVFSEAKKNTKNKIFVKIFQKPKKLTHTKFCIFLVKHLLFKIVPFLILVYRYCGEIRSYWNFQFPKKDKVSRFYHYCNLYKVQKCQMYMPFKIHNSVIAYRIWMVNKSLEWWVCLLSHSELKSFNFNSGMHFLFKCSF